MYKLRILTVGKTKETWLDEAIGEYTKRLKPVATIEWVLAKDDAQLALFVRKETAYVCLDLHGKQMTSESFSTFLIESLLQQGSRLSFVIGGADGLPAHLKQEGACLGSISLSAMTFTHQIARLILCEQLYRAFEIAKRSKYHK